MNVQAPNAVLPNWLWDLWKKDVAHVGSAQPQSCLLRAARVESPVEAISLSRPTWLLQSKPKGCRFKVF